MDEAASGPLEELKIVRRVVLVGGGTAGHVYPALAVAKAYQEAIPAVEILFFGTADGFEARLVPRSGYALSIVRSSPIMGQNMASKARALGSLSGATLRARRLLQRGGADLVIGLGGYASVPTLLAARTLGILTAIHECNASAGLANKMLGWVVDRVYLGFETAAHQFPARRTLVTGNPVRPDVAALALEPRRPATPGRPARILVTGGSQGSAFLNQHVPALLIRLASQSLGVEVIHQTGQRDDSGVPEAYRSGNVQATVVPFIDDMPGAYRWADMAITCAGAATLAELAIIGLPALLVPLSSAAHNHQVDNAAAFAQACGGSWVREDRWNPEELTPQIGALLRNQEPWIAAVEGVRRLAKPQAGRMLVADCEATIKSRRAAGAA